MTRSTRSSSSSKHSFPAKQNHGNQKVPIRTVARRLPTRRRHSRNVIPAATTSTTTKTNTKRMIQKRNARTSSSSSPSSSDDDDDNDDDTNSLSSLSEEHEKNRMPRRSRPRRTTAVSSNNNNDHKSKPKIDYRDVISDSEDEDDLEMGNETSITQEEEELDETDPKDEPEDFSTNRRGRTKQTKRKISPTSKHHSPQSHDNKNHNQHNHNNRRQDEEIMESPPSLSSSLQRGEYDPTYSPHYHDHDWRTTSVIDW